MNELTELSHNERVRDESLLLLVCVKNNPVDARSTTRSAARAPRQL